MNEQEFRSALRDTMVAGSPPPPMDAAKALEVAKQAHRRRRATMASAGVAMAVVVSAVSAVVALGGPADRVTAAGQPNAPASPTAPAPRQDDTKPQWPTGPDGKPQQDRTATAGPQFDKGAKLLHELGVSLPTGISISQIQRPVNEGPEMPLQLHQSQFEGQVEGREVWSYLARVPVDRTANSDAGIAQLVVEVHSPGNKLPTEPCALAGSLWDLSGECVVATVGDSKVGVVTKPSGDRRVFDQWAAYRSEDGTVVYVAQAKEIAESGVKGMAEPPLTVRQLAELATNPRFRLS